MVVEINYGAVLVAAISNMILGMLWYGPLFGKQWMKCMGWKESDMEKMKNDPKMRSKMPLYYLGGFISALVMAYVLSHIIDYAGATDLMGGVMAAFWVWLGFVATVLFSSVLWEGKAVNHYLLNVGYYLVGLVIMGVILVMMG